MQQNARLLTSSPGIPRARIFVDGALLGAAISPPAASITRHDLDNALWESAVHSGVTARQDCTAQSVTGSGPFTAETREGTFAAKAVINATGRWSNLTSPAVRMLAEKERWIGIKAHFREPDPEFSVDLYFFEGGYCGVQPVGRAENGHGVLVNACAMVRADVATSLREVLYAQSALRERSRRWVSVMNAVTTSPLVFHEPELVHQGMLQAGDSATFVDPFIGDGISLALRSGALAAECLIPFFSGSCSLEQAASEYQSVYRQKLAAVYRNSSRLRRALDWPSIVRRPALSLLQRSPRLTSLLVRMTR